MQKELGGPFVVLVTPFDKEAKQDLGSYGRLLEYCTRAGVAGFTLLGESSEVEKLSEDEKKENVEFVMERYRDRVPLVIGSSRNDTKSAVDASVWAEEKGASAVMVAPPKNPKLREVEIFDYYSAVGDSISIPIVVQDYPATGHPIMSPQLIAKISNEVSGAEYLKLEDPPTPSKLSRVKNETKGKLKVFGALAGKASLWELDRGAVGIMTASPTPEYLVALWNAHHSGDRERAKEIFFRNLALIHSYSEAGLSVRKEILFRRGVIGSSAVRQPAIELDEKGRAEVGELLGWTEKEMLRATGISPLRA